MSEGLVTEDLLFFKYASLCKALTRWDQHQVSLLRLCQIKYVCCLD